MAYSRNEIYAKFLIVYILIEFQNDWMAPDGGINAQFKDRDQFDASKANARKVLDEARGRGMEIIYVTMTLDPSFKTLGQAQYGLRATMPQYKSFLGKQAEIFPGFEPRQREYVIRERTGSSVFGGTTLDSYLRKRSLAASRLEWNGDASKSGTNLP